MNIVTLLIAYYVGGLALIVGALLVILLLRPF